MDGWWNGEEWMGGGMVRNGEEWMGGGMVRNGWVVEW